jgi:hypothetical protein
MVFLMMNTKNNTHTYTSGKVCVRPALANNGRNHSIAVETVLAVKEDYGMYSVKQRQAQRQRRGGATRDGPLE